METIYILQDENYSAIGATFEENKAMEVIIAHKQQGKKVTYRSVPFYKNESTVIELTAGPIPAEFFK